VARNNGQAASAAADVTAAGEQPGLNVRENLNVREKEDDDENSDGRLGRRLLDHEGRERAPTGVWAEELVMAHRLLRGAGQTVEIASPGGARPTFDEASFTVQMAGG
jgi:putative intracellular protease/amidase